MSQLLDHHGRPFATQNYKKDAPPVLGEAFGNLAGRDTEYLQMPGGGVVQFDLSRLTLSDFRQMLNHYQINSSLTMLTFMLHQLDWHIECDNKRIATHCEANMRKIWTRLVRAMGQAFWSGYSPNILQWENDTNGRSVQLAKVKDLAPEEAVPNWKYVDGSLPLDAPEGARPPKIKVFDGMKVSGFTYPVPVTNTFWYTLMMENQNYYGKKLLRSAFQPWFFSMLIHLFSNRYFERFGEPVPIGRAPLDETVPGEGGTQTSARAYMAQQLQALRSRAVVVLPSDKQLNESGAPSNSYEYDIEYLESQMRGADFERYLTRLDEEISLALFTPLLLIRTAAEGSYNLGVTHLNVYMWQLNAISGDWAEYIDRYILAPMANYNFGSNSARPRIVFHQLGKTQAETNRAIVSSLVAAGKVGVDLEELGQAVGLTLEEIKQVTEPAAQPENDDRAGRVRDDTNDDSVADSVTLRIRGQVEKAFRNGSFGKTWVPDYGFTSKIPHERLEKLTVLNNAALESAEVFETPAEYMTFFSNMTKDVLGV